MAGVAYWLLASVAVFRSGLTEAEVLARLEPIYPGLKAPAKAAARGRRDQGQAGLDTPSAGVGIKRPRAAILLVGGDAFGQDGTAEIGLGAFGRAPVAQG